MAADEQVSAERLREWANWFINQPNGWSSKYDGLITFLRAEATRRENEHTLDCARGYACSCGVRARKMTALYAIDAEPSRESPPLPEAELLREAIARVKDITERGMGATAYRDDLRLILAAAERGLEGGSKL